MSDFLFDEFSQVSAKQWKQKIQFDLKGADYNETLVWESNEGVKVRPFYHQDELKVLDIPKLEKDFSVCQTIFISDEKIANFLAKDALKRGATSIQFEASEPFDIAQLLNELVIPSEAGIHFKLQFLSESFISDVIVKTKKYKTFLTIDLIGNLARTGNWFIDKNKDYQVLDTILRKTNLNTTTLAVDATIYQNAGANSVQQLAYALAHANEYLNIITSETKQAVNCIQFSFSVGSNYFFEIAKLRAFRYLWKLLCDEYNLKIEPHIFVQPGLRNKTLYDYNVNMLRTTTECMSAILGGASTISNVSYDAIYHKKNEFGERIARNQLILLQEESYFKKATQFADGSYYIEELTKQLAEKGLELFKDIEKSGGFLKQLFEGTIQRKLEESALKEQSQFDNGQEILLGANKHPNNIDKMKDDLELYPFVKTNPRKTLIRPIIARRLAEKLEKVRLEKE